MCARACQREVARCGEPGEKAAAQNKKTQKRGEESIDLAPARGGPSKGSRDRSVKEACVCWGGPKMRGAKGGGGKRAPWFMWRAAPALQLRVCVVEDDA